MNWEAVGVISAILALTGSILFHLFKTTWWMATLTSSLNTLTEAVHKIQERIIQIDGEYARKDEVNKEFGRMEQSLQAAHRRIDEVKK